MLALLGELPQVRCARKCDARPTARDQQQLCPVAGVVDSPTTLPNVVKNGSSTRPHRPASISANNLRNWAAASTCLLRASAYKPITPWPPLLAVSPSGLMPGSSGSTWV